MTSLYRKILTTSSRMRHWSLPFGRGAGSCPLCHELLCFFKHLNRFLSLLPPPAPPPPRPPGSFSYHSPFPISLSLCLTGMLRLCLSPPPSVFFCIPQSSVFLCPYLPSLSASVSRFFHLPLSLPLSLSLTSLSLTPAPPPPPPDCPS